MRNYPTCEIALVYITKNVHCANCHVEGFLKSGHIWHHAKEHRTYHCGLSNHFIALLWSDTRWLENPCVVPVYKSSDPKIVSNNQPTSLLSLPSKKINEPSYIYCILRAVSILVHPRRRPLNQLHCVVRTSVWYQLPDNCLSVEVTFFDLAFDWVTHNDLLTALRRAGVANTMLTWFANHLSHRSQQVVLDGSTHNGPADVPHG